MAQLYIWVTLRERDHHFAPQLTRHQNVGFIDRTDRFATETRGFKSDFADAFDFSSGINLSVNANAIRTILDASGGKENKRYILEIIE